MCLGDADTNKEGSRGIACFNPTTTRNRLVVQASDRIATTTGRHVIMASMASNPAISI